MKTTICEHKSGSRMAIIIVCVGMMMLATLTMIPQNARGEDTEVVIAQMTSAGGVLTPANAGEWTAQSFVPDQSYTLTKLSIYFECDGGNIRLQGDNNNKPDGNNLASTTLPYAYNPKWDTAVFPETRYILTPGTKYWIVKENNRWNGAQWNPYPDGVGMKSNDGGTTWSTFSSDVDFYFQVIGAVDVSPPETTASLNPSTPNGLNNWYVSDVSVSLSVTDTTGTQSTKYKLNNGGWLDYTGAVTISADGTHTIDYYSVDVLGHVENVKFVSFGMDRSPPTTSFSATPSSSNGWYNSDITANLTGVDTVSGVDYTKYRIDGGGWVTYTGNFSLLIGEGTHNLEYYSVDKAGNTGGVVSTEIKVDKTKPTASHSISPSYPNGDNGWYISDVSLTLTGDDSLSGINTVKYRIDNGDWQNYGSELVFSADGTYTIGYYPVDNASNIGDTQTVTIKIDKTAPTTSSALSGTLGSNGWYTTDVAVSLSTDTDTSGISYTKYKIDSGSWQTGNNFTITNEGTHTVYIYSIDNAGNEEIEKIIIVKIDKTKPSTAHSMSGTSGSNGWYTSDVVVSLTPEDLTAGVSTTKYKINTGDWQTGETFTLTNEGTHVIYYYSVDNATNQETEKNFTIKIDKNAPSTAHSLSSTSGSNGWYVSDVLVSLSTNADTSGVNITKYKIGSGDWQTGTSATLTQEGTITVYYYSIDNAGNIETENSAAIKIDKTAPATTHSLSGTAGGSGWYVSDVTVSLSPSDATSGTACTYYQINSGATQTGTSILLTNSGTYTIKYWSVDNAGNTEQDPSVTVKIDKGKPTVSLGSPSAGAALDTNTPALIWSGSDDASGISYYEVQVDNNNNFASPEFTKTTSSTSTTTTSLPDNTYYWCVRAVDNAGNVGDWQERTFTISTGPPTNLNIKINNDARFTNSTQVTLTLSASANAYEMCFSNDAFSWSSWEAFASTKSWGLAAGADSERTVYFKARNLYGDESESAFDTIVLDTTAPSIQITEPQDSSITNKENITVKGEVRDLNGIEKAEMIVNDTSYSISLTDGNFSQLIKLSNGTNTIKLKAKDHAENRAEISIVITYDPTIPTLIVYTPANNSITNNSQCLVSGKTEPDYTVKVNGISVQVNSQGEFSTTVTLYEGSNAINASSTNSAGTTTTLLVYVTLDTAPPSSPKNVTITPAGWTNVNSFTIDWNNPSDTTGIAGAWYKIGSVPASNKDSTFTTQKPLTISLSNTGTQAVYIWLQDNAGNTNCSFYSIAYAKYDPYKPSTILLIFGAAGQNGWYLSDVQVELSSTDNLSLVKEVWYNYEGVGWRKYACKFNVTTSGSHKIEFYALDNAGNAEATKTEYIRIDKDSPYSNLTAEGYVGSPDWFVGDVQISIEGRDDTSGVYATLYRIGDEGAFGNYTSSFTIVQEGVYKVYYYTVDIAGNTELTRCRVIGIDKTPPTTTISIQGLLGNDNWYVTPLTFTLISQDTISGIKKIEYKINQGIWEEYTCPITLQDGIHTITYFGVNNAGLQERSQSVTLKIDHTSPITNISATRYFTQSGEILVALDSTIKLSAEDNTSGVKEIKYRMNNSGWNIYCEPIFLEEGIYTIHYYSIDFAGNTECINTKIIIIGEKTLNPIVEITYPVESADLSGNVSTSYTARSVLNKTLFVTVKFLYDRGEIIIAENITPEVKVEFSTVRMANGVYTLRIIALDSDGRIGYKEINVSVNNKMILEILVPSSIAANNVIQITAVICNYLRNDECFAVEFYFDDLYIGCNQTSILKIFEKEKLSLSYKVNSTTEHCVSVKLFTKNRQLVEEKKIYFAVASVAEEQSNEQAGFNFIQFSIPVFMCACFGILYISWKRKISSLKVPSLKHTNQSYGMYKTSPPPYSSNPLKSPEEVQRVIAEYKNKLRGEKK